MANDDGGDSRWGPLTLAGEDDVKRFYTEAEAAAKLDHPGIVPIFEIGQHEGQHYFSMGYIEGIEPGEEGGRRSAAAARGGRDGGQDRRGRRIRPPTGNHPSGSQAGQHLVVSGQSQSRESQSPEPARAGTDES